MNTVRWGYPTARERVLPDAERLPRALARHGPPALARLPRPRPRRPAVLHRPGRPRRAGDALRGQARPQDRRAAGAGGLGRARARARARRGRPTTSSSTTSTRPTTPSTTRRARPGWARPTIAWRSSIPRLRVKGVRGLRIADGSIMPFLPAINPCITTMMIGEKCADMVAEDARAGAPRGGARPGADARWRARRPRRPPSTPCSSTASGGRPARARRLRATSPATGEAIGTVPQGDRGDAERAIAAADRAFEGWSRLTAFERAAKMHAVGDAIERRRDELAPHADARPGQAAEGGGLRRGRTSSSSTGAWRPRTPSGWAASCRTRSRPASGCMLVRRARGAVGIITPWNWPYTMPAELLAPALACGNTVVWTPAPTTAVCAVALAECMAEADLPPGVFNLVTGPGPGGRATRSPATRARAPSPSSARPRTGRSVASAAAGKAAIIEMGGNGPIVVHGRRRSRRRRRGDRHGVLPVRRAELHGGRAHPRPRRRCATSSSTASRAA